MLPQVKLYMSPQTSPQHRKVKPHMELKRLTLLRTEKSISQKDLAHHLHLSPGTISNYENGRHSPDPDTLCNIADFFHVSVDYLLNRSIYPDIPSFMKEPLRENKRLLKIIQLYFLLDERNQKLLYFFTNLLKQLN